jgi:hypothetical protein
MMFQGFYQALAEGLLDGSPDVRLILTMSGFTADKDAIHLEDVTLDEFDGLNYVRIDCANVTSGYDETDDEWQLHADSDSFGEDVAPGSDIIEGMVAYLHVDGTEANDMILGRTTEGGFGVNAANGDLSLTVPASGLLFDRDAA